MQTINKVQHEIKRGDIWLVDLGNGVGSEQKMKRPVFVIQNNLGNLHAPTVTILPLTSQNKKWMPTHATLHKTTCLTSLSMVLGEQISTISKERFLKFIGRINPSEIESIENAVLIQLGISLINKVAYA